MNSADQIIITGCRPIDDLLGGGIECGVITQIYGEAGSGKTNLCIQAAVECIRAGIQSAELAYDDFLRHLNALSPDAGRTYLIEYAESLGIPCNKLFPESAESGDSRSSENGTPENNMSQKPNSVEEAVMSAIRRKLHSDLIRKVVFIDTEGLSAARFSQIAGPDSKEIASQIIMFEPMDLDEQYTAIREIENIAHLNIGLVIIDSATAFYRYELDDDISGMQSRRELTNQIGFLHSLSRKYGFAALITNQVFSEINAGNGDFLKNMTGSNIRAIGGRALEHISKTILFLEKAGTGERKATIVKHRSKPEGDYCRFRITERGLERSALPSKRSFFHFIIILCLIFLIHYMFTIFIQIQDSKHEND